MTTPTTIGLKEARHKIADVPNGKLFSVTFVKRTDGSHRDMTCQKGVKLGVKGKGLDFEPDKKGLVMVMDNALYRKRLAGGEGAAEAAAGSYRCFPIDGLVRINAGGRCFDVEGE